jgi:Big-like domain-containing protein
MTLSRTNQVSSILAAAAVAIVVGIMACPGRHGSGGSAPTLVSVTVSPTNPTIALGTAQQFLATGILTDGTTTDLTAVADWTSSDAAGSISSAASDRGLATALGVGSTAITATYSGVSGSTTLTVSSAALVSLEITPPNAQIALGTSRQFAATGIFTDGSTQDLTGQVAWESSAAGASTISNDPDSRGLAQSAGLGDTTISASLSGVSGSTTLTVSSAVLVSLEVTPQDHSIALGANQQFAATGTFSDGTIQDLTTQVLWDSSAAAALVSNDAGTKGLADSISLGSVTISATHSGVTGSTTLTISSATLVSIEVTPTNPAIALGTTQAFTATGTFTDGSVRDLTAEVAWSSSEASVAAVANAAGSEGLASSIAMGTATITAETSGISGSTSLAVSSATLVSIEVTPSHPSAALGTTQAFVATGIYTDSTTQDITADVTWASSDVTVATVSNAPDSRGLATTGSVGSTTVTATLGGQSGSTIFAVSGAALVAIAVSPDGAELAMGTSQAFSALGLLSDGTRQDLTDQVTWSSSNNSLASVSNADGSRGLVIGGGVGSVTISATHSGVSGSAAVDVSAATLVSIDISPFAQSMAKGTKVQFFAMGNYSDSSTQDLTSQVAWSTSDGGIAAISNASGSHGLATGVGVGFATISAELEGIFESVNLGVTAATLDALQVTPADPSVPSGMACTFQATGVFSDAGVQDLTQLVTWSSSDTSVATISNAAGSKGLAQSVGSGTTVITAIRSGKSVTTVLTVSSAVLVSISVQPADPFVPAGYSMPLAAVGHYSDGSTTSLTSQVLWSSSNPSAATISNSVGSEGRVTGVNGGTTTLSATLPPGSGVTFLTVTNESLSSIEVEPASVSLALGESQQMTATGYFSGGSVLDITSQVKWTVTPRSIATVGNSITKGTVTAKKAGGTTIKASKGNRTGTASLSVH